MARPASVRNRNRQIVLIECRSSDNRPDGSVPLPQAIEMIADGCAYYQGRWCIRLKKRPDTPVVRGKSCRMSARMIQRLVSDLCGDNPSAAEYANAVVDAWRGSACWGDRIVMAEG